MYFERIETEETGLTIKTDLGYTYPWAGSTIGPAMTFGYFAAKHAMGANS